MTPTEKVHFWQQQINDWEATDLSGSAYCKQQSLIYHQFVYWRQKLSSAEGYPKPAPRRQPQGSLAWFLRPTLVVATPMV